MRTYARAEQYISKSQATRRGAQAPGRNKQPVRVATDYDASVEAVTRQALRGPINSDD